MPLKLQVLNNFKFKYFFGGQVLRKALALVGSICFDVLESSHMGGQRCQLQNPKLTTITPQNCNTIP
jgi:hypothetical protein